MESIETICGIDPDKNGEASKEILLDESCLSIVDQTKSGFNRFKICPGKFNLFEANIHQVLVLFAPWINDVMVQAVAYFVPDLLGLLLRRVFLLALRHADFARSVCQSGEKSLKEVGGVASEDQANETQG